MNDNRTCQNTGVTPGSFARCNILNPGLVKVMICYQRFTLWLDRLVAALPPFLFRLILACEFWEAGIMKYEGENWFTDMAFPFPFNLLSSDTLWLMATWLEIVGAFALVLGLATRFFTLALMILTIVAIKVAHLPSEMPSSLADIWKGYAITDEGNGNFKLPLLFLLFFLPLLINGAGKWSLDYVINKLYFRNLHM